MRKLFLLTAILLFTVSLSAQTSRQKELYKATLATSGATTVTVPTTGPLYALDFGDRFDFKGRFDLSITVRNVAGTADVIAVLPHYLFGNTWHQGDTITFSHADKDDVFSTTTKYLYPQGADSTKLYLLKFDPTEDSVAGTAWDAMYWTVVSKNAASCKVTLFMHPY